MPFERLRSLLAFLEIYTGQAEAPQRRMPRLAVAILLLVRSEVEWTTIDLSPFGVKVPRQASFVNLSEADFRRITDFCSGVMSDRAAIFRMGLAHEFEGAAAGSCRSRALLPEVRLSGR